MSYCCDRARSVTSGLSGGLPSIPHGVWLNPGSECERFLGAVYSNETVGSGDAFTRPSAGSEGSGIHWPATPRPCLWTWPTST